MLPPPSDPLKSEIGPDEGLKAWAANTNHIL